MTGIAPINQRRTLSPSFLRLMRALRIVIDMQDGAADKPLEEIAAEFLAMLRDLEGEYWLDGLLLTLGWLETDELFLFETNQTQVVRTLARHLRAHVPTRMINPPPFSASAPRALAEQCP